MPRINGNNVTQFLRLNVTGTVYVNDQELGIAGGPSIDPTEQWTQIDNDLHITGNLYFDGALQTPTGAPIPADFSGTVLSHVNILERFAEGGLEKFP